MFAIDYDGQFRAFLDFFDCSIAILDGSGVVVSVNSSWELNTDSKFSNISLTANMLDALRGQGGSTPENSMATGIENVLDGSSPTFTLEYLAQIGATSQPVLFEVKPLAAPNTGVVVTRINTQSANGSIAQATGPGAYGSARFATLIRESSEAYAILGEDRKVLFSNPAFHKMLGYPPGTFEFGVQLDLFHPEDKAAVARNWELTLASPGVTIPVSNRVMNADGVWIWIEGTQTNQLHDPAVRGVVVITRDVSKQRQLEADLRHLALHDQLTGLPNRTLLRDRLDQALLRASANGHSVGILFIDLDGFKQINAQFGHMVGDAMLRRVADRLGPVLHVSETLARIGGDEFAVLLPSIQQEREASIVADRLQAEMLAPFDGDGNDIFLGVSIGIAISGDELDQPDAFLRRGDDALLSAKQSGRGRHVLYHPGMSKEIGRRRTLESDIRWAAGREEFVLHYQPIVKLATGMIVQVEALLRWNHPSFGVIPPNEFIPIAEETGQIIQIGEWVLRHACHQLSAWGADAPAMAVNFSAAQFRDQSLVDMIMHELQSLGINPQQLHVEITEGVLIDDVEAIIGNLHRLRECGVIVTIDDFGTGYSSLRYLRDLPVDGIKIDRSFVSGLESDAGALAIVEGITSLAHAIGLTVTAEGIETAEQLSRLRDMGCDFGQGFYLATPVVAGKKPPGFANHSR